MSQETSTGWHYLRERKCELNEPLLNPFWSPRYVSGRGEVSTDPMKMFLLKDWTYVGRDGVVATKTLRSTCGGMCDEEVATFTLKAGDGSEDLRRNKSCAGFHGHLARVRRFGKPAAPKSDRFTIRLTLRCLPTSDRCAHTRFVDEGLR